MPMTPLSRNVIANFGGKLCVGLLTLGLIPFYIKFMGMEAYGLIGLFATLQSVLLVLDMGLSTTLNRELARLTAQEGNGGDARDLVRTLEVPYWLAAVGLLLAAWPIGTFVAPHWIHADHLPAESVRKAMVLMGLSIGLQFPTTLYSGGLMGLQRQVLLNAIVVATATFRGLGAIIVLWKIDPSIEAFLTWQVAGSAIQTAVMALCLWRGLPSSGRASRVRRELLAGKWGFAGGVVGITVLSIILTQTDKIILSKLLPLEQFGYYAMASVAATALGVVVNPLFSAVFPRFSQLVAAGDVEAIKHLYHKSCQVMSVVVLPPAIVLILFSREIMLLWTQSPTTAEQTFRLVSLLAAGTALNGLMNIPYALQLGYGHTRFALGVNVVAITLLIPLLLFLTQRWGAYGAAWVWAILNAGYVLIALPLMHRRLLPGEQWRWYWADSALPLAAALGVSAGVRSLTLHVNSQIGKVATIAVAGILTLVAAALAAGRVRTTLMRSWNKKREASVPS